MRLMTVEEGSVSRQAWVDQDTLRDVSACRWCFDADGRATERAFSIISCRILLNFYEKHVVTILLMIVCSII